MWLKRLRALILPMLIIVMAIPASVCVAEVDTAWVRYEGFGEFISSSPRDIAIDADGSIYVAGKVRWGVDLGRFALVKYNPQGDTLWKYQPFSTLDFHEGITAIEIGAMGHVFVTGALTYTARLLPTGDTLWERRATPGEQEVFATDIAVDSSGNAYVVDLKLRVVKFAPNGDTLWARQYHNAQESPNLWTPFCYVTLTGSGIVVTGMSASENIASVMYTPSGDTVWTHEFDGSAGGRDWPTGIAAAVNGSIYVVGITTSIGSSRDGVTLKYSPEGALAWARLYNGPASVDDGLHAVVVDGDNNVCVTGDSWGATRDYVTIKYTALGDTIWTRKYNSPEGYHEVATSIGYDDSGNIYVTGWDAYSSGLGGSTIKYSGAGDERWVIDYPVSSGCAPSIAVGSDGSLYTAGSIFGGDFTTSRYINDIDRDSDGTFDALDNCPTTPNPLQENADGDIYGDSCDNCRTVTNEDQAITITMTGDVNESGMVTSADVISMVGYVFRGQAHPIPCAAVGDVDCSGSVTSADIVFMVGFVFKGGPFPCNVCEAEGLGWSCP